MNNNLKNNNKQAVRATVKHVFALLLCAFMLFALCACSEQGEKPEGDGEKLRVVCTLFPQYDFVREIAGDCVELTLLLPPGVESHSYDPTPSDMKAVASADIVIRVGENMETWSGKLMGSAGNGAVLLDLADEMGLELEAHEHGDDEHTDSAGERDPHIWTDPVLAKDMVRIITEKLCELDEKNAAEYDSRSELYISELEALDKDIKEIVGNAKRKTVVFSGRFALKNFTDRYGLTAVSALDACADNSEPSAAAVAKIVDTVKDENIPVIFYEELIEPKTAKIISSETGAKMLLFHSCHNLSKDDFNSGETYLNLMRKNVEKLREALL